MQQKRIDELDFVSLRLLPTVEVDQDSLDEAGQSLAAVVEQTLRDCVKRQPELKTTIYLHGSMSVSFDTLGYSMFIGVAGPRQVLKAIAEAFAALPGVLSRYGEDILASDCTRDWHIQDGRIWQVGDASFWFSTDDEDEELDGEDELLFDEPGSSTEVELQKEAPQLMGALPERRRRRRPRDRIKTVAELRRELEAAYRLPVGSVQLVGPDNMPLRGNTLISTLYSRWDQ